MFTPTSGEPPQILDQASFVLSVSPLRQILSIATEPCHPREQELVGVRAGGSSRDALDDVIGDWVGHPLFQLLDDFAGASLVSGWIWTQWNDDWLDLMERQRAEGTTDFKGPRADICIGLAEGSSGLDADQKLLIGEQGRTVVVSLVNPKDPLGWHPMPEFEGPQMRRARRIDLWRNGDMVEIDAAFQDSGHAPDGARIAVHEYALQVIVDPSTMAVRSLHAQPLILPFPECPGAVINTSRMVGQPVGSFRKAVLEKLPGTQGCTHLNDALRALADVPALIAHLPC